MRSLSEIIKSNREAARVGIIEPGTAVGTSGVNPVLYDIVNQDGEVVEAEVTIARCAQYRDAINAGRLFLQPASGQDQE